MGLALIVSDSDIPYPLTPYPLSQRLGEGERASFWLNVLPFSQNWEKGVGDEGRSIHPLAPSCRRCYAAFVNEGPPAG